MSDSLRTLWTTAHQSSLSITNCWSLLKLMSIKLVIASNHLILCGPLLLLPSIFPSIRVFSNESVLCIRWPKCWNFSSILSILSVCALQYYPITGEAFCVYHPCWKSGFQTYIVQTHIHTLVMFDLKFYRINVLNNLAYSIIDIVCHTLIYVYIYIHMYMYTEVGYIYQDFICSMFYSKIFIYIVFQYL